MSANSFLQQKLDVFFESATNLDTVLSKMLVKQSVLRVIC